MHTVFALVGLPDLAPLPMTLLLAIIALGVLMFGWICDLLLGPAAFGTIMNSLIMLVGAFVGAWLWQRYGFPTRFDPVAVKASVAVGTGMALVLGLAMVVP